MRLTRDMCQCRQCGLVFRDEAAFDAHRKPYGLEEDAKPLWKYLEAPTAGCIDPSSLFAFKQVRDVWTLHAN